MKDLHNEPTAHGQKSLGRIGLTLLGLLLFPIQAAALGERVQLHGFGTWSFGDTDGNTYLFGKEEGDYDHLTFALNTMANVTDELTIAAQVDWSLAGEEEEVELDYAFASWKFSDHLRFQVGRIQQPLGIYSEIFEVGTLRPATFLPQSVYGPTGVVAEGFRGIGLSGAVRGDWGFDWNVYTGEVEFKVTPALAILAEGARGEVDKLAARVARARAGEEDPGEDDLDVADTFGFRLNLQTPIEGLSFGVSAYAGRPELEEEAGEDDDDFEEGEWGDHAVIGVHARYLSQDWSVAAEYLRRDEDIFTLDSSYLEVAYRFSERWQAFGRWDYADLQFVPLGFTVPEGALNLTEHQDIAVGVGYWFDANFVLRLELHSVNGNLFANSGEDLALDLVSGELEEDTTLFQVGASFSF